jgi:hypothetical protein
VGIHTIKTRYNAPNKACTLSLLIFEKNVRDFKGSETFGIRAITPKEFADYS